MRKSILFIIILSFTSLIGCANESSVENNEPISESNNEKSKESNERSELVSDDEKEVKKPEKKEEVKKEITESELEDLMNEQPLKVVDTDYIVQSTEYKTLYPDMLQAIIENNSGDDIRDAVLAFVAWDSNGLPLKLEADFDLSGGQYVYPIRASDINLPDGEKWGYESGFSIAEHLDVGEFKAIVISYKTFEDEEWKNEYFNDFKRLYEGKKRE